MKAMLLLARAAALLAPPAAAADDPVWLAAHNGARARFGEAPLVWSAPVAAIAQSWADTLAGEGCALRHSGGNALGENLAWFRGRRANPAEVVALWMSEEKDYDISRRQCRPGAQRKARTGQPAGRPAGASAQMAVPAALSRAIVGSDHPQSAPRHCRQSGRQSKPRGSPA